MSALGAAFARGLAGLGGPGAAAAIVAGGIVVGALGGGLAATQGSGGGQPASSTGKLAVYACPDSGAPLVMIQGGQKLLVTGRTEDSGWLRIHFPEPGRPEAWVQASPLQVDGAVASLPVATCMPELAIASPSIGPAMSLTAVQNNPPSEAPSPEATPTPPTPSPTASAVANARPTLSSLTASTNRISYDTGNYCPTAVKKVTFRVKAADSIGVASVALYWREPGAGNFARTGMTRVAGSAKSGTWQVSLDTAVNGITKAGRLAYYAVATDGDGATRRIPTEGSGGVTVSVCVNQGPTITAVSPASGTALYWDPLGAGNCQTARNITATVKDIDGIKSVTLYFRRPGASGYSSKPMDNTTLPGKWFANLDSLGDKITITSPPTDSLRWYIKAVDTAGKATQLATRSMTLRRCDTEAQFDGVFPTSTTYACTTSATMTIATYANDPDQPQDGLKVVFHWSLMNPRTNKGPITGTMAANLTKGNYYQGTTKAFDGKTYYEGRLTVYAITTDRYGGTTTSPVGGPYRVSCP